MSEETCQFKVNDRVKRKQGDGCHGFVKEIRKELATGTTSREGSSFMVKVQWDNGTTSYFSPEALENVG